MCKEKTFKKFSNIKQALYLFFLLLCATSCGGKYRENEVTCQIKRQQLSLRAQEEVRNPLVRHTIVIDAGHGGSDEGTASTVHKYQEKDLTLQTAMLLKGYLQKMGYKVIMTRTRDVFIPLEKRASLANQVKANVFVSMHYNSAQNKEASGIEVHYYESVKNPTRSRQSKRLAEATLSKLVKFTGANSRGVKASNFAVIRQTEMAAILVEGGFLTNAKERQLLKNNTYLESLAWSVARGIDDYLK